MRNWDDGFGILIAAENLKIFIKNNSGEELFPAKPSSKYQSARGLMLIDVVGSVRRRYATHVAGPKGILARYSKLTSNKTIKELTNFEDPKIGLSAKEWKTVTELAQYFQQFGMVHSLTSDDEIINTWANSDSDIRSQVKNIKGIGPALYNYLLMLSGGDSIKVDSRVISSLQALGLKTNLLTQDGIYFASEKIAEELGISLFQLDQILWKQNSVLKA